jgi:hypothetical protein
VHFALVHERLTFGRLGLTFNKGALLPLPEQEHDDTHLTRAQRCCAGRGR